MVFRTDSAAVHELSAVSTACMGWAAEMQPCRHTCETSHMNLSYGRCPAAIAVEVMLLAYADQGKVPVLPAKQLLDISQASVYSAAAVGHFLKPDPIHLTLPVGSKQISAWLMLFTSAI